MLVVTVSVAKCHGCSSPSSLNQPPNRLPSFSGGVAGSVALPPFDMVWLDGVGSPPLALNVTVYVTGCCCCCCSVSFSSGSLLQAAKVNKIRREIMAKINGFFKKWFGGWGV